jgi:DNA-binding MarR family transcriptional regulator
MREEALESVVSDLFSIPPLLIRNIRRKLVKIPLANNAELTPLHFEIMRLLDEEGTLHAKEIAAKLQIAKAQMTQIIDKLVTMKLLTRSTDTSDRRIINIDLTDSGKQFLQEHKILLINYLRESLSSLTDEELTDLTDSLRKFRDILVKVQ